MTSAPKVSLIIVSRDRVSDLRRLLVSLRFLQYPSFEVVVVADKNPISLFPDIAGVEDIKYVPFDKANISAARNLGLRFSAGDIVAFCDDDAVPEPTWLNALVEPFEDANVGASGGYVIGRNGISFQWRASTFDRYGSQTPLDLTSDDTVILTGDKITGIKTEGTNMAFRAQALRDLGGFDENYHYFLDETDVNYRLGAVGWKTAIVPLAQVHHGFSANSIRTNQRTPTDLTEIGASKAYFCQRHGEPTKISAELDAFRHAQRKRLIALMVAGVLEPFDVDDLLASLERGISTGKIRQKTSANVAAHSARAGFKPYFPVRSAADCVALTARIFGAGGVQKRAKALVEDGTCVTLFRFSLSARFHKTRFITDGYWLQTGGIWGKSDRVQKTVQRGRLLSRVKKEIKRLKNVRPMKLIEKQ